MIDNHSHSGLGGDGEKIDYNNLINTPTSDADTFDYTITSTSSVTFNVGFKPSLIEIRSFYTTFANDLSKSWTVLDGSDIITSTVLNETSILGSGTGIEAVYVGAGDKATITSITESGFTLGNISRTQNIDLIITVTA